MSKRGADNYLTDQNWDQEEESEEAGVFKQADKAILQTRQLKKAKRRVNDGDNTGSGTDGAFKGFSGFGGFTKTTQSTPAAAFDSLGSKPLSFTNGSTLTKTTTSETAAHKTNAGDGKDVQSNKSDDVDISEKTPSPSRQKYLQQLKALNEGVSKWIKEHVDKNPYCILTPIFKDYDKYLVDIEKKNPQSEDKDRGEKLEGGVQEEVPLSANLPADKVVDSATFNVGKKLEKEKESSGDKPFFSFSTKASAESTTSQASTTPSNSSSTGLFSGASGFSFANTSSVFSSAATKSTGFSFASVQPSQDNQSKAEGNEEDEYVPPKADVTEVCEDDAIYSKRCKLFFKKEDAWKEKGVGNLHLKPCGEKTQLLIRADTNLGNILLNIMLSASMPISRQGKNNISIICIPNPPIDPKSDKSEMVPLLVRVKTTEDADELFEKLKEHKT